MKTMLNKRWIIRSLATKVTSIICSFSILFYSCGEAPTEIPGQSFEHFVGDFESGNFNNFHFLVPDTSYLLPRSSTTNGPVAALSDELLVNAYPNPADDFVYLTVNKEGFNTYQLLDINGKAFLNGKFEFNTILTTESIPNGIYIIVVENNGLSETKTFKVIVMHE